MAEIRVLIVDDHAIFCESLASLLIVKGSIEIVGSASTGKEALQKLKELHPDIVLMDIEMKEIDGIRATQIIKEMYPEISVVILTMHSDEGYLFEAIKAGADGYVLKDFPSSFLLETIDRVSKGENVFDPLSIKKIVERLRNLSKKKSTLTDKEDFLTRREAAILKLVAEGNTNREIANTLFISEHTVRNHLANIFSKFKCGTRTRAISEATKRGFI